MQAIFRLFLFYIVFFSSVLASGSLYGRQRLSSSSPDSVSFQRRDDIPPRAVFVQLTTKLKRIDKQGVEHSLDAFDSQDIRESIYHASLEVQGDGVKNGNIRIEIDLYDGLTDEFDLKYAVRVRDYGLGGSMEAPVSRFGGGGQFIKVFEVGTVNINNDALLSTEGRGIVTEVWSPNNMYSTATNNCIRLVGNLLDKMGIPHPSYLANVFAETSTEPYLMLARHGKIVVTDVPIRLEQFPPSGDRGQIEAWSYDVGDGNNPKVLEHVKAGQAIGDVQTSSSVITGTDIDGSSRVIVSAETFQSFFDFAPPIENYFEPVSSPFTELPGGSESGSDSPRAPFESPWDIGDDFSPAQSISDSTPIEKTSSLSISGSAEVALVRTGGLVKNIISVAEKSLVVLAVGAEVVAALYIILDIVNGDFKAAAFGAAGLAAGIAGVALDLLVAGPIGTIVGLVAGILFTILPGLISSFKDPPPTNNPAQIIQFAFFGDKGHTGNEGCNAQRKAQGLSQNCTAVYGAGVLSKIFKWNTFDSIAFLLQYNEGHAMSIVDIAAAFQVKDYTVTGWGSNVTAAIDCGARQIPSAPPHVSDISAYNAQFDRTPKAGYSCSNAHFSLQRQLIKLPALNSTADLVYSRIIPAPGGDCKLLSDPVEGIQVPLMDLTVTGRPVAIACNLTSGGVVGIDPNITFALTNSTNSNTTTYSNGTILTYNPSTNATSNITYSYNPSNQTATTNSTLPIGTLSNTTSTDGSNSRVYVAPPPPVAFVPYNASDSVCIGSPGGSVCLPNGTYGTPTGALGFNTKGANSLTLAPMSQLSFDVLLYDVKSNPSPYDVQGNQTVSYFQNITAGSSSDFNAKMNLVGNYKNPLYISVPGAQAPGACLHLLNDFQGDVQCFGLGGANLTGPIVAQASSISFRGNASAWIYGASYGDLGGVLVTKDVADLSTLPYGSEKNFNKQIRAMWIKLPS